VTFGFVGGSCDRGFAVRGATAALDEKQQSAEIPAPGKRSPLLTVGFHRPEMGRNGDSADTLNRLADAADVAIAGVERKTNTGPDSSAG
jgi:hypothetical protein